MVLGVLADREGVVLRSRYREDPTNNYCGSVLVLERYPTPEQKEYENRSSPRCQLALKVALGQDESAHRRLEWSIDVLDTEVNCAAANVLWAEGHEAVRHPRGVHHGHRGRDQEGLPQGVASVPPGQNREPVRGPGGAPSLGCTS